MIKFVAVQGDVIVEDRRKNYCEMARSGMELAETGNYLIATTQTSTATIMASGKTISLPQSSFMRIRGDRTWWDRHYESWNRDTKRFIGRLWWRIAGDPRDPGGGSGGGGIRG